METLPEILQLTGMMGGGGGIAREDQQQGSLPMLAVEKAVRLVGKERHTILYHATR